MEENICQSCGMHMKSAEDFSTNADGTQNMEYCHYCYQNGAYTRDVTVDKILEINRKELIAPCGMNCRLCFGYIRLRNQCLGCNAPNNTKPKSCINCKIVTCEKRLKNGWLTCADCETPCRRLKDLDKRYRSKYHMSMIENLATIRNYGMDFFLQQQNEKYQCHVCGKIVCVHRNECPTCNAQVW